MGREHSVKASDRGAASQDEILTARISSTVNHEFRPFYCEEQGVVSIYCMEKCKQVEQNQTYIEVDSVSGDEPHGSSLPSPGENKADQEDWRSEVGLEEGCWIEGRATKRPESLRCERYVDQPGLRSPKRTRLTM